MKDVDVSNPMMYVLDQFSTTLVEIPAHTKLTFDGTDAEILSSSFSRRTLLDIIVGRTHVQTRDE